MTWEIFAALLVFVGAAIPIGKIIANNTEASTELREAIKYLTSKIESQDKRIDKQDAKIETLETENINLKSEIEKLQITRPYCDKRCCDTKGEKQ